MQFITGILRQHIHQFLAILCLAFALVTPTRSKAAGIEYSSRLWQMEDGLPHSIVQAITQTRDGYLWIGTREGLTRFDGVNFTFIDLTPGAFEPSIMALYEAHDGSLWIATENAGLFRLRNGRVSHFRTRDGLPSDAVFDIVEDASNLLWVATRRGLARYQEGEMRPAYQGKISNGAWSLAVDKNGYLWAGAGLNIYRIKGDDFTTLPAISGESTRTIPSSIRKIFHDSQGKTWIGSNLYLTELTENGFVNYTKSDGPSGIISVIYEDREHNMWVGTYAGLGRFEDGAFIKEDKNPGTISRIHSIYEDREGNMWIGSEEGLARLIPKHVATYTQHDGLSQNTTASVCASRDGGIWVGVWGGGIDRIVNGKITSFGKENGLKTEFILSVLEAKDGSLWAGSDFGGGLQHIQNDKVTHYGPSAGFPGNLVIASLCEDDSGSIWIGARTGLFRLRNGKASAFTTRQGLSHNRINALCNGHDGILWIGTENGLMRRENEQLYREEACQGTVVVSIYEDKDKTLWVGTYGAGLKRIKDGHANTFTSKHGLYSDSIFDIVEDDRENLWVNSSKGIFRVSKQELNEVARGASPTLTSIRYGKMAGIIASSQYREPVHPSAVRAKDGKLWFRTNQGVASVDPNRIQPNTHPPEVIIEQVLADKKLLGSIDGVEPVALRKGKGQSPALEPQQPLRLAPGSRIAVPPGQGELEIRYVALSFTAPEHNHYKYRLEGVDTDWVEAGNRRFAYYYNLAPGEYLFRVLARNNDGVWNDLGSNVSIVLKPHYWQTWWFIAFCALSVLALVAGTARFITKRRLQQRMALLEQQHVIERERARIARDMHDDLGARLTEIMLLSDFALKSAKTIERAQSFAARITDASRELITNLDGLVWTVNPENDTLPSLASYLREYLSLFLQPKAIRCRMDFPDTLPPLPLSSELRHHVLLAIKEAVSNAVKYSDCSELQFHLKFENGLLSIVIEDDGKGFNPEEASALGNGLKNMRKRMESVGGTYELTSTPGKGTTVKLTVQIPSDSSKT